MTRTDVLKKAVADLLEERRAEVDRGILGIQITVKYRDSEAFEPRDVFGNITFERRKTPRKEPS